MRFLFPLSLAILAPFAVVVACGGDSDANEPPAANDAAVDTGKKDSTTKSDGDVEDDASDPNACVDASLKTVSVPDAALNETGTATTATCVVCARTKCAQQVDACDQNCACKEALIAFYACQGTGKSFTQCGFENLSEIEQPGQDIAQDLGTCVFGACNQECNAAP